MAKVGIFDLFKATDVTDAAATDAKADKADSAEATKAKEEKTLPSDVLVDPEDTREKEQEQDRKNSSPAGPVGGSAETDDDGWTDWNFSYDDRFLVVNTDTEDGDFFDVPDLLPLAFRIFESCLQDGDNDDKHAAHGALKFLTDHYQEFPAPQPQQPSAPEPKPQSKPEPQPKQPAPAPSTPKIKIPESLARVIDKENEGGSKVKARLPLPARGYIDPDGRVHSYVDFKNAGYPSDWDEKVIWKFANGDEIIYSSIRVPDTIADDFERGLEMDIQTNHELASAAQDALKTWNARRR